MKKILLLVPYNRGTIGSCSLNIYTALKKRNDIKLKCVLIHKFKDGYKDFEDCEYCIEGAYIGIKRLTVFFKEIYKFWKIKKIFKPDITISTLFSCSTLSVLTGGKDIKIGVFHSPHTQVKCLGKLEYNKTLWTYRHIYPRLDYLYCVSNEVKKSILSSFPSIAPEKVDVVYNIHDVEHIKELSCEDLSEDEKNIFKNPVILYCGRLDKNKAPERLLKAFISATNLPEYTRLVYIGDDMNNYKKKLLSLAEKEGLINRVHILGRKSNPYKYMLNSKALVSCSYSEGLPGVLIESMLLGVPVVSTNSSAGVWEILNCYENYNSNLENCYIASKGIITSNLGKNGTDEDNEKDVRNLSLALEQIFSAKYKEANFEFEHKVKAENIIKKFLLENPK